MASDLKILVLVFAASTSFHPLSSWLLLPLSLMYKADLKPLPDMAELEAPDFFIGDFLGKDPNEPFFSAFFSSF